MERQYVIELDEIGYVQLMQLAMKYGSGTGLGDTSLSIDTRVALAEARIVRRVEDTSDTDVGGL